MDRVQDLQRALPKIATLSPEVTQAFPLFPTLPGEMQDQIWKFVATESRIIKLFPICIRSATRQIEGQPIHPGMLHACHDSRKVGLRAYIRIYELRILEGSNLRNPNTWLDEENDEEEDARESDDDVFVEEPSEKGFSGGESDDNPFDAETALEGRVVWNPSFFTYVNPDTDRCIFLIPYGEWAGAQRERLNISPYNTQLLSRFEFSWLDFFWTAFDEAGDHPELESIYYKRRSFKHLTLVAKHSLESLVWNDMAESGTGDNGLAENGTSESGALSDDIRETYLELGYAGDTSSVGWGADPTLKNEAALLQSELYIHHRFEMIMSHIADVRYLEALETAPYYEFEYGAHRFLEWEETHGIDWARVERTD